MKNLFFFLILSTSLFAQISGQREILLLQSYHQGYKWSDDIREAVVKTFKNYPNVEITTLYMDTKRISTNEYLNSLAKVYEKQFIDREFDLILAADNVALDFALEHHKKIFKTSPIIFLGINDFKTRFASLIEDNNLVTGVVEEVDIVQTVKVMKSMNPNLNHILVLNDKSETGLAVKDELNAVLPLLPKGVKLEYIDNLDMKNITRKAKFLNPKTSAVLFLLLFKDSTGKYYTYKENLEKVYEASKAPIFCVWDFYLGVGAIGGMLTSASMQGGTAANMALKYLQGVPFANLPIVTKSPNRFMFDFNELKRFKYKIPNYANPHTVVNKPFSFYETYKALVWSIILISLIVANLIAFLINNIIKRRNSEKALKSQLIFITTLLDTVQNPIFYKDTKGRYIGCNEAFASLLNRAKDEIVGKTIYELFPKSWAREHDLKDKILLKTPNSNRIDESTLHFPNAPMKHFIIHKASFLKSNGQMGGIVSIMDDVTDRIQERQFLVQQTKLAEMGEMIAAIAHQWNEPLVELSAITQDIEMAFYNEEIDEEIIKDFVKDSMLQIQYMSKTLKDFRNFLKPSLKKAYFDIKIAISDVLELVDRQVYYHNITLSIDYGLFKGEVLILGYENEFKQVLLNIINNAKKKIVAKNSLLKEEKKIEISICVHEEIVQMKIKDSAGGINSHIKDHMFDPYFTTTKNGTGLGLYMAKVIIEDKMGGSIRVESEDESVSFLINMPRNISSSLLAKDKLN